MAALVHNHCEHACDHVEASACEQTREEQCERQCEYSILQFLRCGFLKIRGCGRGERVKREGLRQGRSRHRDLNGRHRRDRHLGRGRIRRCSRMRCGHDGMRCWRSGRRLIMREDDAALQAFGSLQFVVELAFWTAHWMSDRSRSECECRNDRQTDTQLSDHDGTKTQEHCRRSQLTINISIRAGSSQEATKTGVLSRSL